MPEKVFLTMKNGKCILMARQQIINNAIDRFFISLAHDQKERATGIVMSGTGTDGTEGVKEIHRNGGKVFIQSPSSASFSSMPASAIIQDDPDMVASPSTLAQSLNKILALRGNAARS